MTREDIIRMGQEVYLCDEEGRDDNSIIIVGHLERFAELVASAEREACHALRQTLPNPYDHCQVSAHAYDMAIAAYGAAIRARVHVYANDTSSERVDIKGENGHD